MKFSGKSRHPLARQTMTVQYGAQHTENVTTTVMVIIEISRSRRIRKLTELREFVEMEPALTSRTFRIACKTLTLQ